MTFMKIDKTEFEKDYAMPPKELLEKYDINTNDGLNRVLMISNIKSQQAIIEGRIQASPETLEKVKKLNKEFYDYLNSPENNA